MTREVYVVVKVKNNQIDCSPAAGGRAKTFLTGKMSKGLVVSSIRSVGVTRIAVRLWESKFCMAHGAYRQEYCSISW